MRDHPQGWDGREARAGLVHDLSRRAAKETKFPTALFPPLSPPSGPPRHREELGLTEDSPPALCSATNITWPLSNLEQLQEQLICSLTINCEEDMTLFILLVRASGLWDQGQALPGKEKEVGILVAPTRTIKENGRGGGARSASPVKYPYKLPAESRCLVGDEGEQDGLPGAMSRYSLR